MTMVRMWLNPESYSNWMGLNIPFQNHRFCSLFIDLLPVCACACGIYKHLTKHPIRANLPKQIFRSAGWTSSFVFILVTPKFAGNRWLTEWMFFFWVYCICGNTTPKQTWNWLCLPSIIGVSTSYNIIQLYIQLQLSFWCCCDCWRSRIRFTRKYAWCMASCLDEPWSNLNVLVGTNTHCTRG